jgi:hypothetical protein
VYQFKKFKICNLENLEHIVRDLAAFDISEKFLNQPCPDLVTSEANFMKN